MPLRRTSTRHVVVAIAAALLLSGCVTCADIGTMRAQAQAALARWAYAAPSGGTQSFVPVGEMTGQVGDWEEAVGNNNKIALMAGLIETAPGVDLSAKAPTQADGEITWPGSAPQTVRRISAVDALTALKADAQGSACPECARLEVASARLTTGRIDTSRGPAVGPIWEFTLEGTAVRVTRVAIARPTTVVPPTRDPNHAPIGISIESATRSADERRLTVSFTGAPGTGDQGCGADYSGEAVESETAVVVIVIEHRNIIPGACSAVGATRTAVVDLAAPLGGRAVLEVQQGLPVPVLPTP